MLERILPKRAHLIASASQRGRGALGTPFRSAPRNLHPASVLISVSDTDERSCKLRALAKSSLLRCQRYNAVVKPLRQPGLHE